MGLIKEPKNVDFYVDPTPLKKADMDIIHEAIAYYKATGKILKHYAQQRASSSRTEVRV